MKKLTLHPFQGGAKALQGAPGRPTTKRRTYPYWGALEHPRGAPWHPGEKKESMEAQLTGSPLNFASRFQRVQGRTPRKCSATAKMTREEHNELEAAAHANGKALGEWAREVLLNAARGFSVNPVFTEVIATRLLLNSVLQHVACGEKMTPNAFNAEMQEIRTTKHKAAQEVMQQYADAERRR